MRRFGGLLFIIESQRKRYLEYKNGKGERKLPKHIYLVNNRYTITKWIDGRNTYFKSFGTLTEAVDYRDRLIANDWKPLDLTEEEILEDNVQKYYRGIYLSDNHRQYIVNNKKSDYLGLCNSIEEALQLRDLYYDKDISEAIRPAVLDLKQDNPYLIDGLKYPLPERLTPTKKSDYGKGRIRKKGKASYHIYHGGKKTDRYYCACRTYEQAYYTLKRLQECDFDKSQVPRIQEEYPKWYTWLMEFYKYIHLDYQFKKSTGRVQYKINIPKAYLKDDVSIDNIPGYSHVEDALYERDWLVANDWDYEALVYSIDDKNNPYWDMEIPPYPERKIRNLSNRDYHEKELTEIFHLIYDEGITNQEQVVEHISIKNSMTLRNWLKKFWNSDWEEFKQISLTGENPINVLTKQEIIYQPDLSRPMPSNFKGWVQKSSSKKSPFKVRKGGVEYGQYPTEKMARAVVKKLIACNWDKSKLPAIKKSVGYKPVPKRGNVYPAGKGWCIRRKNETRKMINYGFYKDKRLAELTRDFLKLNNWDKDLYPSLRAEAEYILSIIDNIKGNMFYGNNNTVREYSLVVLDDEASKKYYYYTNGRYQVSKFIDGKLKFFGCYDTADEAAEIVEILKLNNWDENVLAVLNEI